MTRFEQSGHDETPNRDPTKEDGHFFERFTGAMGVVGSMFRGRPNSGQPLIESAQELNLSGIPVGIITDGLERNLAESAAEHTPPDSR